MSHSWDQTYHTIIGIVSACCPSCIYKHSWMAYSMQGGCQLQHGEYNFFLNWWTRALWRTFRSRVWIRLVIKAVSWFLRPKAATDWFGFGVVRLRTCIEVDTYWILAIARLCKVDGQPQGSRPGLSVRLILLQFISSRCALLCCVSCPAKVEKELYLFTLFF